MFPESNPEVVSIRHFRIGSREPNIHMSRIHVQETRAWALLCGVASDKSGR